MIEIAAMFAAGFLAGVLNAIAGGGTFITFPTLVWLGVPVISANATATLAALPGYAGSAWAFRQDMAGLPLRRLMLLTAFGGAIGAALLIVTPPGVFRGIVPWLLLAATLLFAFGPRLLAALRARGRGDAGPVTAGAALLAVAIYGGYFNGGLGIVLLAAFSLLGHQNLHAMNGMKNLASTVLSAISVLAFIAAGLIAWKAAAVMALATTLGGYAGARISRRITRTDLLRHFVVAVGLAMTLAFLVL
ncbi:sulfite exporter TauE/SafE family protein [Gemmobacter denitrificans]|uniref:Probable membrane transporter protein n=1 Tax=Gemmobacter denitrificans TaxID=3123040 RepID=A0ABU8BX98_9RHOB